MSIERARVIKARFVGDPTPSSPSFIMGRRVAREEVEARAAAAQIVARAQAEASAIVESARASIAKIEDDAREREIAKVAAELVASRAGEESRAERELDRTVEIARLLAERLVGEAIRVEPERIAALAHEVLRETRGARRIRIEASPEDAPTLARLLGEAGRVTEVVPDPALARGSLVVHTELGRIDGRLAPQLSRLADALEEALRESTVSR
jgi:flagellar assembly protein FliH/type III secretion protein L